MCIGLYTSPPMESILSVPLSEALDVFVLQGVKEDTAYSKSY